MPVDQSDNPTSTLDGRVVWALRGLCAIAIGLSVYLAYTSVTGSQVAGCSGDLADCNTVLKTRWSSWFGIPVSLFAMNLYLLALAALWMCSKRVGETARKFAWKTVTFCGISAALAAVWFVYLQVFEIGKLCYYCLGVHSCGLIFAGMLAFTRPISRQGFKQILPMAALGITVLIVGQYNTPEPKTYEVVYAEDLEDDPNAESSGDDVFAPPGAEDDMFAPPDDIFEPPETETSDTDSEEIPVADTGPQSGGIPFLLALLLIGLLVPTQNAQAQVQSQGTVVQSGSGSTAVAKPEPRSIPFTGGRTKLDIKQWPLIGRPDAKYAFIEMFDYTCTHCRSAHRKLKTACNVLNKDVAIIALPVPMAAACNPATRKAGYPGACEIANLAVAVWKANPSRFEEFHNWAMDSPTIPTVAQAEAKAQQLVGTEQLNRYRKLGAAYVTKHVQLYRRIGQGSVPKLIFQRMSLVGEPSSAQHVVNTIQREANIRP